MYDDYDDLAYVRFRAPRRDVTGIKGDTGWFRPMNSLYARCTQGTYWTDASGTTWTLEDMTPIHRKNLLAWLERRAEALHKWAFENGKISYEDRDYDALPWLETLPLVKCLRDLTFCPTCGHEI